MASKSRLKSHDKSETHSRNTFTKKYSERALQMSAQRSKKRQALYWIRVMARRGGIHRINGLNYRLRNGFQMNSNKKSKTSSNSEEELICEKDFYLVNKSRFIRDTTRKPLKITLKLKKPLVKKKQICDQTIRFTKTTKKITKVIDGKVLDRIICVFNNGGKLCHLIKWKGSNRCVVCESETINQKWPQVVIQYYQKRLVFK